VQRVFITGANGRVGLELVRALCQQGQQVIGLARSEEKARAVVALGAECLVGSLAEADTLAQGLDGAEIVYHLAGGLRGDRPEESADRVNRQGMADLLQALDRVGTGSLASLVFTSTCAVYGHRDGLLLAESLPPLPNTRYGRSKVAAEQLLLQASARGVPGRIVRLAAVYGPGFPFMLVDSIRRGRSFLPGTGQNIVPTIHAQDAIVGLQRVAEQGRDGQIYNLADTRPVRLADFYAQVQRLVGGRGPLFWSGLLPQGLDLGLAALNERLQARLGRKPVFTTDNIRLFQNDAGMRVKKIEVELGMRWRHPWAIAGLESVLGGGSAAGGA